MEPPLQGLQPAWALPAEANMCSQAVPALKRRPRREQTVAVAESHTSAGSPASPRPHKDALSTQPAPADHTAAPPLGQVTTSDEGADVASEEERNHEMLESPNPQSLESVAVPPGASEQGAYQFQFGYHGSHNSGVQQEEDEEEDDEDDEEDEEREDDDGGGSDGFENYDGYDGDDYDDDDYDSNDGQDNQADNHTVHAAATATATADGAGPGQSYHSLAPVGIYLSEETDEEPGGAQLPPSTGGLPNPVTMPSMFSHDIDMESTSEYSEDSGDEATLTPYLGVPSDIFGVYLQASYSTGNASSSTGEAYAAAMPLPNFNTALHAAHVQLPPEAQQSSPPMSDPSLHPTPSVAPFTDFLLGVNLLAPRNLSLEGLVFNWGRHRGLNARRPRCDAQRLPCLESARAQLRAPSGPFTVHYDDLEGDVCDLQGIDWDHMGVTRRMARERRHITYRNYVHRPGSDRWFPHYPDVDLPNSGDFFKFKRMDVRKNVHLAHFQLRNLVACSGPNQIFYTGRSVVHHFNPLTKQSRVALSSPDNPECPISTIDAAHGVVVSGNFNGEYLARRLEQAGDDLPPRLFGTLTSSSSAITNHVQIQLTRRSATPQACFASNDAGLRLLDLATDTIVSETMFPSPINCTAISPDGQLRVMVGDHEQVLVVPADGSRINVVGSAFGSDGAAAKIDAEQELLGHRDHGFACAWADDGRTVATGFQDRIVKIWDARNWRAPLTTIRTNMAGARSLRFSPVGSGRRVLVAAEEADYVSIIDARTFKSKQTIDFFGEIGGVSFEPTDGRDLFVFVTDPARGGVMQLERCDEVGSLSDEVMQYRPQRQTFASSGSGGQGCNLPPAHTDRGSGSARWQPPRSPLYQSDYYLGQKSQPQPQQVFLSHDQRQAWVARRPSDVVPALPLSDWPQDNLSPAARRSRRAQARRRHREAVLEAFDNI